MRSSNSVLAAIALAICSGILCPAALAAGVDAKSVVDAKVRCRFPAVLAKAVRERARHEMREEKQATEEVLEKTKEDIKQREEALEKMKEDMKRQEGGLEKWNELNKGLEMDKKWAVLNLPSHYRWCAVDLNDDGRLEVIYETGFCGMGGCISQVLAWRGAKLTSIGTIGVSHYGPMIGKRCHRGWRDLYIWQKGSSSSFSIPVYTFRRGAYRAVGIPLMFVEFRDTFTNPDGVTIERDSNEFHIGAYVPEEERAKRLKGHRGLDASHWQGGDPGYREEAYEQE